MPIDITECFLTENFEPMMDEDCTFKKQIATNSSCAIREQDYCYLRRGQSTPSSIFDDDPFRVALDKSNSYNQVQWMYHDPDVPLTLINVINPRQAGALGIIVPIKQGNRYLFSSGPLSGCSVAVLTYKDKAIMVHAGADGVTGAADGPDIRNRDLLQAILLLLRRCGASTPLLAPDETFQNFYNNGKFGFLAAKEVKGVIYSRQSYGDVFGIKFRNYEALASLNVAINERNDVWFITKDKRLPVVVRGEITKII